MSCQPTHTYGPGADDQVPPDSHTEGLHKAEDCTFLWCGLHRKEREARFAAYAHGWGGSLPDEAAVPFRDPQSDYLGPILQRLEVKLADATALCIALRRELEAPHERSN